MPFTETAEKEAIDVSYEFDYTRERRQTAYKQLPFLWGRSEPCITGKSSILPLKLFPPPT